MSKIFTIVVFMAVFSLLIPAASIPSSFATTIINEDAKLTASDAAAGDAFGISVSNSGDTAVVGTYIDDGNSGSAYVFERNEGGANNWGEVVKIKASDAAVQDQFASAVSISGDTIAIGAWANDEDSTNSGSSSE